MYNFNVKYDFDFITPQSPHWPEDVQDLQKLWFCGDISLLDEPGLSIVGTRHPSSRGMQLTRDAVDAIGDEFVIVSGLALGIDGTAHIQALARNFRTVAVLGTPIDAVYPKEHEMLQEMVAKCGLLVSQFEPGTKVQKYFFMQRNLTMSRISKASLVVESGDGGGGVSQARYSEAGGKPVLIFRETYENRTYLWPRSFSSPVIVDKPKDITRHLKARLRLNNQPLQPELFFVDNH